MSDHPAFDDDEPEVPQPVRQVAREYDPDMPPEALDAERDPDNAGNPIAVAKKRREQVAKEKLAGEVVKNLMATPPGRAWLAKLLFETCGLMKEVDNAAFDTNGCHYRAGARAVALDIQKEALLVDPKQYIVLMAEHLPNRKYL